jgi:hypothetical protein
MKSIFKTLLFLLIIAEVDAQNQPAWVNGQFPKRKNTIFIKEQATHTRLDSAQIIARLKAFQRVVEANGLIISFEQIKALESETRGLTIIKEKEEVTSTTKIIGKKVGIKGLWQEGEWTESVGGKYIQYYLFSIPNYNVGALAFIPTAPQYIRKEYGKAVIFSVGTLALLGAPLVNVHSNNLRVKAEGYKMREDIEKDFIRRADNTLALCRVMYAAGIITYVASTIDGISKNRLYSGYKVAYSGPVKVRPYFTSSHTGLTLSIALK